MSFDVCLHNSGYESTNSSMFVKSEGAFLFDAAGRKYLDAGLGAGSQILGHAHSAITEAIVNQAKSGCLYLQNNPVVQEFVKSVSDVLPVCLSDIVLCNTGTEATQRALRLARAATGKDRIAYFHGGWHGMNEWTLLDDGGRFGTAKPINPSGIPRQVLDNSLVLPYNDEEAFSIIKQHANELACVIIEPVQGSNPRTDIVEFLSELREVCTKFNILLVFDEIITGFRLGISGATIFFGINPDIATYGKILGGGLPIGLLAFTRKVADLTYNNSAMTMLTGGTFSANPLVCAAASKTINILRDSDYGELTHLGDFLLNKTNKALAENNIPFTMTGCDSIFRLAFTDKKFKNRLERDLYECPPEVQKRFRAEMLKNSVIWPTNGIIFIGFCHNRDMLADLSEQILMSASKCL
ncbi:aminotransferase class III-fold pyridoxal phosphate-dependent enzyme [Rheinheimera sp.]|uniref:aminotransferase class III-fold pyridoxal phosphate-dependent enzyme n=1 Tax=Rheinheimera sp. TaxID=1869214 RepID=UPI003D2B9E3C